MKDVGVPLETGSSSAAAALRRVENWRIDAAVFEGYWVKFLLVFRQSMIDARDGELIVHVVVVIGTRQTVESTSLPRQKR